MQHTAPSATVSQAQFPSGTYSTTYNYVTVTQDAEIYLSPKILAELNRQLSEEDGWDDVAARSNARQLVKRFADEIGLFCHNNGLVDLEIVATLDEDLEAELVAYWPKSSDQMTLRFIATNSGIRGRFSHVRNGKTQNVIFL